MKKRCFIYIAFVLAAALLLAACALPHRKNAQRMPPQAAQSQQPGQGKPSWCWKPGMSGKVGGVGIAGQHINGLSAQRELAVQRAVDDIARQLGVNVSSILQVESTGTRDSAVTQVESYSIQTVEGKIVKAQVKEFWEDPKTGELYVWLVVW